MKENLEEIYIQEDKKIPRRYIYIILGSIFLVIFSYYFYTLIWGVNSYEVYRALKEEKKMLQSEVEDLENKNVELQKIIFELNGLEPTMEEDK